MNAPMTWGRVFGSSGNYGKDGGDADSRSANFNSNGASYDYSTYGLQVGTDLLRNQTDNGSQNYLGVYVGIARATANVDAVVDVGTGDRAGSTSMNGYSLGAYYTMKGREGGYVDAVAQFARYASAGATSNPASNPQSFSTSGMGILTSLEGGLPFALNDSGLGIEPQAQGVYQHMHLGSG
jgi:outer membrane autotransporter protein